MSIWTQAVTMAERTPPERNRYVDFLRAVSILVVITGHWLIAGFQYVDGAIVPGDILALQPRTQWLTWLFQVMPIFFMVGGYANAVSLESARRKQLAYADWLAGRLARLVSLPSALPLLDRGYAIFARWRWQRRKACDAACSNDRKPPIPGAS